MSERLYTEVCTKYLHDLESSTHFLECLEACGLHEWDGVEEAMKLFASETPENLEESADY